MNRFFAVISICLFAGNGMAQKSIGMTLGRYYNWGQSFGWKEELAHKPTNPFYDSAAHSGSTMNSSQLQSSFMVGANFRVKPENENAFMYRWSRNYSIQLCEMTTQQMFATDAYHYTANIPYTTILQGDTAKFSLDSNKVFQRSMSARGGFAQLGFGLMREIKTDTRIVGEFGFRISAGAGKLAVYADNSTTTYLKDENKDSPRLKEKTTSTEQIPMGTNTLLLGQFELMGGIIIPLAKDDNTWWLNIHGALGIGAMNYVGTTVARMNFLPSIGVNYRILPKDQRTPKPVQDDGWE